MAKLKLPLFKYIVFTFSGMVILKMIHQVNLYYAEVVATN